MSIDANQIYVRVPASARLEAFKEVLASHTARLLANPLDEEAAFAVRHFQAVVDELREEVKDEWPDYVYE
jgi:hypothetical protein